MGVRNKKREELKRLDSKTLDARFLNEIRNGLNCSPFEAEAVLEVVKEVYFPFLDEQSVKAPPGKVTLIAVSADESPRKRKFVCQKSLPPKDFLYKQFLYILNRAYYWKPYGKRRKEN